MPSRKPIPGIPDQTTARCYIRVSRINGRDADTDRDFQSPEQQIDPARHASRTYDWRFDEEASMANADLDQSGFRKTWRKRPGIMAHLAAAQRGEFQVLIVLKLSRLARNAREGLEIFDAFEKAGVRIVCIREHIDTGTAAGRMLRTILLAVAEMQAEELSEYAAAAMKTRAEAGKPPPYLPTWIRKDDISKELIIDESVASALRRLIELRCTGHGYNRIARMLNDESYKTTEGHVWTNERVSDLLSERRNIERFAGIATWDLMDGNTIKIPNAYPAIATEEQMQQLISIAATLRRAAAPTGDSGKITRSAAAPGETQWLLSSVIYCAVCGARLRSGYSGGAKGIKGIRGYRCENCRATGPGIAASASSVEEAVLRVIEYAMEKVQSNPQALPKRPAKPKPTRTTEQIEGEISRLVKMYIELNMSEAIFREHHERLRAELVALETQEEEGDEAASIAGALAAMASGDDRLLILHSVVRVEAPKEIPHLAPKTKNRDVENRRYAVVTLRFGEGDREYTAPLYRVNFNGTRAVYLSSGEKVR